MIARAPAGVVQSGCHRGLATSPSPQSAGQELQPRRWSLASDPNPTRPPTHPGCKGQQQAGGGEEQGQQEVRPHQKGARSRHQRAAQLAADSLRTEGGAGEPGCLWVWPLPDSAQAGRAAPAAHSSAVGAPAAGALACLRIHSTTAQVQGRQHGHSAIGRQLLPGGGAKRGLHWLLACSALVSALAVCPLLRADALCNNGPDCQGLTAIQLMGGMTERYRKNRTTPVAACPASPALSRSAWGGGAETSRPL